MSTCASVTSPPSLPDPALLQSVEQRVLWLAMNIVHHANHVRPNVDGLKVGGHQTSSASLVTILTLLYFEHLRAGDKVSVKPHASPVFHAIQYLLGRLDAPHLLTLRQLHGLQAYPSRTKDPDPVDFSTGSVGLGSIAPNFAALVHRYLQTHRRLPAADQPRFVSIAGDAELDEGSIWEAIAEPALHGAGRVLWIIDLNRQSLDRIIPGIRVQGWRQMFTANGWNVIDVKYGAELTAAFARPGGELLRACVDGLSNTAYQRLLRQPASVLREWLPRKSLHPADLARFLGEWDDEGLVRLFANLGGHDVPALRAAFAAADRCEAPTVLFAYTLKGRGLPSMGHPQNHSALLSPAQMRELQQRLGIAPGAEWDRFPAGSAAADLCAAAAARLRPPLAPAAVPVGSLPTQLAAALPGLRSTQQTFGHLLTAFAREAPELGRRLVTLSPDVATSTNLGGWINRSGVWRQPGADEELPAACETSGIHWTESELGQHIELGISENNLFMALGQFGLAHELFGELLLPIGTLYDPFVRRGLDAFFYDLYAGARFLVVGTPSGLTLAPEGGLHQSLGTQSIGAELPELDAYEPCFGQELEWIFLHALEGIVTRRASTYLRLSTRPVDQSLCPRPAAPAAEAAWRAQVIRGAYRLVDRAAEPGYAPGRNAATIFAAGVMVPEAIEASRRLCAEGIFLNVVNVTGPGPLYRDFHEQRNAGRESHVESLLTAAERTCPAVTLVDDHPHSLAWIGSALGAKVHPLGVTRFGQSGSRTDLYREYGLDADRVVATVRRALA